MIDWGEMDSPTEPALGPADVGLPLQYRAGPGYHGRDPSVRGGEMDTMPMAA
jgi:hypothetical protein